MSALPTDIKDIKEIQLGELNDYSFDMEGPLVTNEFNGMSLFTGLLEKFLERVNIFSAKKPHKGIVLLSTVVNTEGMGLPAWAHKVPGAGLVSTMRNFAVVRVPEVHAHIPSPSMQLLLETNELDAAGRAQLPTEDKLLLSMHDAYFSAPIGSDGMQQIRSGDIVLLDGDGFIIKIVDPTEVDASAPLPLPRPVQNVLDWAKAKIYGPEVKVADTSSWPGVETKSLDDLDPDFRKLIDLVIAELKAQNYEYTIRSTWRSWERQEYFLAKGWTTTRSSQHMNVDSANNAASYAVDFIPNVQLKTGNKVNCKPAGAGTGEEITPIAGAYYLKLLEVAKQYGLNTGGAWFGVKQCHGVDGLGWDPAHVQYPKNKKVNIPASGTGVNSSVGVIGDGSTETSVGGSGDYGDAAPNPTGEEAE